jgi:hypothetical protein
MRPKDCAYIVEHLSVRFMAMVADHSRQLAEHRAAFGARTEADAKIIAGLRSEIGAAQMAVLERDSLISERDGLLTQVQDMRAEIERLRADIAEELNESPPAPPEASHDTTAGKEAAASVIRNSQMTEIKVGDVVEVVSTSGGQTWMADVGSTGKVRRFELIDSIECVRLQNLPGKRNAMGGYVSLCDVRKVPQ